MNKFIAALLIALLALVACTSDAASSEAELPEMDLDAFVARLESSAKPAVVNVWASWCLPCRDEAPLFTSAHAEYGDRIDFYGVAYNDNQPGARQFLAEFDLPFTHYFDFDGDALVRFGGIGVPRTYFFGPGGELANTVNGVLTEDTLTSNLEELLGP
ncbi:MAG TPA: TlpA disulfide reductase family protein [Acidimicrobiia bacterium]|nr:TlpA disulfide reductase family protein [Acidimicrobiia bacterium]